MTASQAESPSTPEAIEDQLQSGGPYGTVSLFGGTLCVQPQWMTSVKYQPGAAAGATVNTASPGA